jgi:hypothetical protein
MEDKDSESHFEYRVERKWKVLEILYLNK